MGEKQANKKPPVRVVLNGAQYRDRTYDLSHVKGTRYRCANWA